MSTSSRNESESPFQHQHQHQDQQEEQMNETNCHQKYSEFNFSGDDSNYGNQSIKSEPRRDIVSPPPQEIKKHKIFLSKNNPANNSGGSITNARFNSALTIPGHNPLPTTNTHKISKKYNAINSSSSNTSSGSTNNKIQSQSVIQGSGSITPTTTATTTTTATNNSTTKSASASNASSKSKRHDNYNKNIYIGTKNAQKWDMLRTKLQCKNDVEFVTHLLNLMEKYTAFKKQEQLQLNSSMNSR